MASELFFEPAPELLSSGSRALLSKLPRSVALRVGVAKIRIPALNQIRAQLTDLLGEISDTQLKEVLRQALARELFPPNFDSAPPIDGVCLTPLANDESMPNFIAVDPSEACLVQEEGNLRIYRPDPGAQLASAAKSQIHLAAVSFEAGKWNWKVSDPLPPEPDASWLKFERENYLGIDFLTPRSLPPRTHWLDRPGLRCRVRLPDTLRESCFALPALRALQSDFPETSFEWIAPSEFLPFWRSFGEFDAVTDTSPPSAVDRLLILNDTEFEELGLAPVQVASLDDRGGRTIHPSPPIPDPIRHRVRDYLDLVSSLGSDPANPAYFPTAKEPGSSQVLLAPLSDFGVSHQVDISRWKAWLENHNPESISCIALPDQQEQLAEVARELGLESITTPNLESLIETLGQHHELRGVDGTLPHLAAVYGLTCTVIFGPGEPERFRPLGRQHQIVREKVSCNPCFLSECPLDHRCIDRVDLSVL